MRMCLQPNLVTTCAPCLALVQGAKLLPLLASVLPGLVLRFLVPAPAAVSAQGWNLLCLFASTIAGGSEVGSLCWLATCALCVTRDLCISCCRLLCMSCLLRPARHGIGSMQLSSAGML